MILLKHEWRQGVKSFAVWTGAIAFFIVVCVFMYPEMKSEMESVSAIFSSLGVFAAAFGMDKLDFGSLTGFYSIECGNILGIGGAFFASLLAVNALAKEERGHTAEFLLTHPVSRARLISEKLGAVMLQVVLMNGIVFALAIASIAAIGEPVPWQEIGLLHFAYLLLQIEISGVCFGISAFIRQNSIGVGIGIAAVSYFMNIIANISDSAEILKYITPFGYAQDTGIVAEASLNAEMIGIGISLTLIGIAAAYWKYCRKDIA